MISLITGASGHVGSAVASELVARGQTVRTLARDVRKIEPRLRAVTDARTAGYEDYHALLVAMRGATQVFLVSLPGNVQDRVPYHSNAVRAAKEAKVKRIVYLSFLEGDGTSPFSYGRENTATEEIIRRVGRRLFFHKAELLHANRIITCHWIERQHCGSGRRWKRSVGRPARCRCGRHLRALAEPASLWSAYGDRLAVVIVRDHRHDTQPKNRHRIPLRRPGSSGSTSVANRSGDRSTRGRRRTWFLRSNAVGRSGYRDYYRRGTYGSPSPLVCSSC